MITNNFKWAYAVLMLLVTNDDRGGVDTSNILVAINRKNNEYLHNYPATIEVMGVMALCKPHL